MWVVQPSSASFSVVLPSFTSVLWVGATSFLLPVGGTDFAPAALAGAALFLLPSPLFPLWVVLCPLPSWREGCCWEGLRALSLGVELCALGDSAVWRV